MIRRTPGIPLTDADDVASMKKPLLHSPTAGLFISSMEIASYTRYLVQPPQSPTAATTASTPLTHCLYFSLSLVSICLTAHDPSPTHQLVCVEGYLSLNCCSKAFIIRLDIGLELAN